MAKGISLLEVAWAARFFDGEGHIRFKPRPNLGLKLIVAVGGGHDPELLLRFQTAIGNVGHIHGPYNHKRGKPYYALEVTVAKDVIASIELLAPYLGTVKRTQAQAAIDMYFSAGGGVGSGRWGLRKGVIPSEDPRGLFPPL